jgi:spermidine synthase
VFVSNLHATSELFYSDIKTIQAVFPQVAPFATRDRGNVIAVAVKYRTPVITDPAAWPATDKVTRPAFASRLDLAEIRAEHARLPAGRLRNAQLLSDDFAPWNSRRAEVEQFRRQVVGAGSPALTLWVGLRA